MGALKVCREQVCLRWLALLVACTVPGLPPGAEAASATPVAGRNGMVVTAQQLATRVGVDVLKRGGNAIDAAVAVGYALAVVYPAAGNLGGGGFMTLQLADGRRTFLDFREKAPLAASRDMFLDRDGTVVKDLSTGSVLAVGVPGTVAGLEYARTRYGTQARADLIAPAIAFAEQGFVLDQGDVDMLSLAAADFRKHPAAADIFLDQGRPPTAGSRLVQADLAASLREIAAHGTDGFYKGRVGRALVEASQAQAGILSQADLDRYAVRELAPIECDYRGYHVVSAPPPSSGGVALCEMLNILDGYPLAQLGFGSAQAIHYEIEAMRHAYIDRNTYLGDPDFVRNPIERLTDKAYAAGIRAAIDPSKAGVSSALRPGEPPHEGSNTTHYSIADSAGNAVSVTYTLNEWFGTRIVAAGTGILLNNEMDDFTVKAGVPNLYGLVQGEANAIAPGKTPLSSMSPTIVTREDKPVLVTGTPGGSRIITVVLHSILNVVDYGMNVQEAADAPRIHNQWLPDLTNVERFALSPDTRRLLEAMGHRFGPPQPANHLAAILIGAPTLGGKPAGADRFFGANDPRRGTGLALGY
ncbi:gamma-glutamyltransferase [Methylobacterium planeticum]|uniref:Glutathione hydrolase proenzyme n=1 Tax=Methylobacterium planeticum TaxID=2615211 RepID=A0A6N6MPA8_9HYPH|nr:gamma-glutamyltransferase [Methylobacterium planeticum]